MLESQGQITHVILAPHNLFQRGLRTPNLKNPKDPKGCTFLAEHLTHSSQKVGYTCCSEALMTPRSWQAKQVNHGKNTQYIYMIYDIWDMRYVIETLNVTSWQKIWWKCPRGKPAGEYILIDAPLATKWRNTFYCTETALLLDRKQIVRYSVNRICEQNLCLFVDLVKGTMCPPQWCLLV